MHYQGCLKYTEIVGTVIGGGLNCKMHLGNAKNSTFQVFNKVPHWVDFISQKAKEYDTQVCVSQLKIY